jgi:hypothetical protein
MNFDKKVNYINTVAKMSREDKVLVSDIFNPQFIKLLQKYIPEVVKSTNNKHSIDLDRLDVKYEDKFNLIIEKILNN